MKTEASRKGEKVIWDPRTITTVLAALRWWQKALATDRETATDAANARALMPDHFAEAEPLTVEELDCLCEALNISELQPERKWNARAIREWCRAKSVNSYELTWGRLLDFIREAGLDRDEYFHLTAPYDLYEKGRREAFLRQRVWDEARWIGVFWCVGGSEGYYVHVERLWYEVDPKNTNPPLLRDLVLLGKFWDWRRAEEAANAVQYLVNHVW